MKKDRGAKLHLKNPDRNSLDNAYRSMERLEGITISVNPELLDKTLFELEETGFAGILVQSFNQEHPITISALKGKHGPCFDTGKKVLYHGNALATIDDDNHLLISGEPVPVCEKTANVLAQDAYSHVVEIIQPKQESTSQGNLRYFDCNTLETDLEKLYALLKDSEKASERAAFFYPGPFRLLILTDGTLVRRGKINLIPRVFARKLAGSELLYGMATNGEEKLIFYQDLYRESGSAWMFNDLKYDTSSPEETTAGFNSLAGISAGMKKRLLNLITAEKKFFILTGSDPDDPGGCCPSGEVSEANRLVRSGILSSVSQEAGSDTCPVTVYAFRNEVSETNHEVKFMPDNTFRESVRNELARNSSRNAPTIIKWFLYAFIIISLSIGIFRLWKTMGGVENGNLNELLLPEREDQLMVLLFHYHKRCVPCSNMELFTRELLEDDFGEETASKKIAFRTIDMDAAPNNQLAQKFRFVTATVVLIDFREGKEKEIRIIEDGWQNYRDEKAFKSLLERAIRKSLASDHE